MAARTRAAIRRNAASITVKRLRPPMDRQVGQVDIDREARHIADEEIDRGEPA
jgi:hypothetical protein